MTRFAHSGPELDEAPRYTIRRAAHATTWEFSAFLTGQGLFLEGLTVADLARLRVLITEVEATLSTGHHHADEPLDFRSVPHRDAVSRSQD